MCRSQNQNKFIGNAIFNNTLISYLFDTGAVRTIINEKLFEQLKQDDPTIELKPYTGLKLHSCSSKIKIHGQIILSKCQLTDDPKGNIPNAIIVVTNHKSKHDCLLGTDLIEKVACFNVKVDKIKTKMHQISNFLKKQNFLNKQKMVKIDEPFIKFEKLSKNVKFDPNVEIINPENNRSNSTNSNCIEEIQLQNQPDFQTQTNCCDKSILNEINTLNFNEQISNEKNIYDLTELNQNKQINEFELNKMRERIMDSLKTVSANSVIDLEPNKNNDFAFKIELIDPKTKPITTKCRPLPYNLKNKVKEEIENQLKAGIIRPSTSEWSSALRIVIKPDGSIRITVDYKQLNKLIRGDSYPLPSIEDLFNKLSEADVFSKFDLKSAYHQIPVHKDSIKYTAFICEFGLFEYLSKPQGIKTAPAWFQRFIEKTFKKLIDLNVMQAFLDDTFIFTNSSLGLAFHEEIAMEAIQILKQKSLKISLDKCTPAVTEIKLLGNVISKNLIKPNPDRAKCLMERDKPKNIQELQSWLGVANQYRKYIQNYAEIAKPLYELIGLKDVPKQFRKKNGAVNGKKVPIEWNEPAETNFEILKQTLCSELVLTLPKKITRPQKRNY